MQRCCFPPALFCIHSWRSTGGRQQLARCPPPPGGALALASFYTGSDHHLTTPSSQPVPCIVFYVPTFFHNHHNQRRKLCTLHNFRRWFMLFACASQFSDARYWGFESPRPQRAVLFWALLFLFESPNYHHNVVLYWKKRSFAFEKIGSGPHQKAHSTRVYSGRRRGFMVYWWQLTERSNRRTRLWRI